MAVTTEAMKGQGTIVGETMADDMEIMKIDTEEATDMAHITTGMTGRECHHSVQCQCENYLSASFKICSLSNGLRLSTRQGMTGICNRLRNENE